MKERQVNSHLGKRSDLPRRANTTRNSNNQRGELLQNIGHYRSSTVFIIVCLIVACVIGSGIGYGVYFLILSGRNGNGAPQDTVTTTQRQTVNSFNIQTYDQSGEVPDESAPNGNSR